MRWKGVPKCRCTGKEALSIKIDLGFGDRNSVGVSVFRKSCYTLKDFLRRDKFFKFLRARTIEILVEKAERCNITAMA